MGGGQMKLNEPGRQKIEISNSWQLPRYKNKIQSSPGFQERSGISGETRDFNRDPGISREIRAFKRNPGFQERSEI